MIYVVYGDTGEYDGRVEWLVAAYTDKAEARLHTRRAQFVVKLYQEAEPDKYKWGDTDKDGGWEKWINPYDPSMQCTYTGTFYGIHEVPTAGDHITAAQKPRKGE